MKCVRKFYGHAHFYRTLPLLDVHNIKKKRYKSQPSFNADGLQDVLVSSY